MTDFNYVIFRSDSGLSVRILLDANSAHMVGGYGGWEVVARPKRVGLTRFKGKDPFRMDVPILFDGWREDASQEIDIATLSRMSEQPGPQQQPPTIRVEGAVPREDLTWVIETIDWDASNVIWDVQQGTPVRLRQAAVVHLLQFVDDKLLVTPPSLMINRPAIAAKTTTTGASLKKLSQDAYGTPDLWTIIADANGIRDPRAPIPPGKTIKIPPKP